MNRLFVFLILNLSLLLNPALAQERMVEGYLYDSETNAPLAFGNVWLKSQKIGRVSDAMGFFSIPISRNDTLIASYLGYETIEKVISIDQLSIINIYLHPSPMALKEIEISAKRSIIDESFEDLSASKFELDRKTILTLPSLTGEPDFLKTLLLLPGAVPGVEGSADIFVRGGDADQNLVLFNGATVYNTGHLFGFLSVFNPYATSDATMLTGGFPAQYGGEAGLNY